MQRWTRASILAAIALAGLCAGGCSGLRKLWPWAGEEGVPVTRPQVEDANAEVLAAAPEPPGPPAAAPAASPRVPSPPAPFPSPIPVPPPAATAPAAPPGPVRVVEVTPAGTVARGRQNPPPASAPAPPSVPPPPVPPAAPAPAAPARPPVSPPESVEQPTDLTALLRRPPAAPASPPGPISPGTISVPPAPAGTADPVKPAPPGPVLLPPANLLPPVGVAQVIAASAVQVNNRFITVDEVVRGLRDRVQDLPAVLPEERFRQQAAARLAEELREQITRALILEEANNRLTDEQKKEVDKEVKEAEAELLANAGGSRTRLRQQLAQEGLTIEQALTEHREKAAFKTYLRSRFMPAIVITRTMLWDYYRQNQGKYTTGKKVQMQIIAEPFRSFLTEGSPHPSDAELQAAKAKAKETTDRALAALKAGEDFGAVARRLSRDIKASDGGVWPPMAEGSFREAEVEKAAFALPEGQHVGPIETETGYYVVRALKVQGGKVVSFEDAQKEIEDTLRDRLYLEQTQKYFKDLMSKAHVVQSERFLTLALDKAVEKYWRK